MNISCPSCDQLLEVETIHGGKFAICPSCNTEVQIPDIFADTIAITPLADGLHARMTIAQFMAQEGIDGVVDLDRPLGVEVSLSDEKYERGQLVAKGGMGAILDVRDLNLRRKVAMKTLLDPAQADKTKIQRFIQEAQVTSQLQHPSIVPIHELGVETDGSVYYTMKFVEGDTLQDILDRIRTGDEQTIQAYSLNRLLNIFQRVCDAIAFAHSKGVIHRDLKPENVMVGKYGEVLVLDWGLAKIVEASSDRDALSEDKSLGLEEIVATVQIDAGEGLMMTMDGAIMGTPGYMAPEQALGRISALDERTDIYALGAILYAILTLRAPVEGGSIDEILIKITSGDIRQPTQLDGDHAPLFHCPGSKVPNALSAVTMKALMVSAEERYERVQDIQQEIEAYQAGFATAAEQAGYGKQIVLLVRRHKTVSFAAMFIGILLAASSVVNYRAKTQAVKAEAEARRALVVTEKAQKKAETTLVALKKTSPALMALAEEAFEKRDYAKALDTISYALDLAPENSDYLLRKANLLQSMLKIKEARDAYQVVIDLDPGNESAKVNLMVCQSLLKDEYHEENLTAPGVQRLWRELLNQRRVSDALAAIMNFTGDGETMRDFWIGVLADQGVTASQVEVNPDGSIDSLVLASRSISDLSPLEGTPLTALSLSHNPEVRSIEPLRGMPLKKLTLGDVNNIKDLTPLVGMPLTTLKMQNSNIRDIHCLAGKELRHLELVGFYELQDLSPIQGMPVNFLNLEKCYRLHDISWLSGMPLKELKLDRTAVRDFSALAGLPLGNLSLQGTEFEDLELLRDIPFWTLGLGRTPVSDLTPLRNKASLRRLFIQDTPHLTDLSPLRELNLYDIAWTPGNIRTGVDVLRNMKSLKRIGVKEVELLDAAEFWQRYDAGEFDQ